MNVHELPVITVTGLREANYLLERGCELIGLADIPESFETARMRFRGCRVAVLYDDARAQELPPLNFEQSDRLNSMLALFSAVMKQEAGL